MTQHNKKEASAKTYGEYRYLDLYLNPPNPRRIFDKYKLDVLEESIRANRILVPLTVYAALPQSCERARYARRWAVYKPLAHAYGALIRHY
jgi:hypothetical protein